MKLQYNLKKMLPIAMLVLISVLAAVFVSQPSQSAVQLPQDKATTKKASKASKKDDTKKAKKAAQAQSQNHTASSATTPQALISNPSLAFFTQPGTVNVTIQANGQPASGVWVTLLRSSDFKMAGGVETDADGRGQLTVNPGEYFIYIADKAGRYAYGFAQDPPELVQVTSGHSTNVSIAATPQTPQPTTGPTGSLTGVVKDGATGQPLGNKWVVLATSNGPGPGTITANDGSYTINDLAPGNYYVIVVDPQGARIAQLQQTHPSLQNIYGEITITDNSQTVSNPTITAPAASFESRRGQDLEEFPFPIMTESPHRFHDPVTGFAHINQNNENRYEFILPTETSDDGLYGAFWLTPEPPTPGLLLAGVRFKNAAWEGTSSNSIVVFSLLDRLVENNATGTVTGAYQGLPNELVAVLFDQQSDAIELKLSQPVSVSQNRFVIAIDAENLPMGQPSVIFPSKITVDSIEWLWVAPN